MSLNHVETIDPELFRMLKSLLSTGKIEKDGKLADFSKTQTISISNGVMTFDPPLVVSGKFGPVRIKSTITEVKATANNSILVDINSSPINVEIRPE